jgi:hypothetical protein
MELNELLDIQLIFDSVLELPIVSKPNSMPGLFDAGEMLHEPDLVNLFLDLYSVENIEFALLDVSRLRNKSAMGFSYIWMIRTLDRDSPLTIWETRTKMLQQASVLMITDKRKLTLWQSLWEREMDKRIF